MVTQRVIIFKDFAIINVKKFLQNKLTHWAWIGIIVRQIRNSILFMEAYRTTVVFSRAERSEANADHFDTLTTI